LIECSELVRLDYSFVPKLKKLSTAAAAANLDRPFLKPVITRILRRHLHLRKTQQRG